MNTIFIQERLYLRVMLILRENTRKVNTTIYSGKK